MSGWPELVSEWHPTRNGSLRPHDVSYGSSRKIWWRCDKGPDHEWAAKPNNRTASGAGCPFCAGRRVSRTNCLAELRPDLAAQWHPTRNGDRSPTNTLAGSTHRSWWKCPAADDHEWQASPHSREYGEGECPFCLGRRTSSTNRLSRTKPGIAREWHSSRNAPLTPDDVVEGSARRVWWRCARDPTHEWRASICNRCVRGSGCPYCVGRRASAAHCLRRSHPAIAREWHPWRNGPLTPDAVTPRAARVVWWECAEGHEWTARVGSRTRRGARCPECARGDRTSGPSPRRPSSSDDSFAEALRGEGRRLEQILALLAYDDGGEMVARFAADLERFMDHVRGLSALGSAAEVHPRSTGLIDAERLLREELSRVARPRRKRTQLPLSSLKRALGTYARLLGDLLAATPCPERLGPRGDPSVRPTKARA